MGGAPDARWAALTAAGASEDAVEWALDHDVDVYVMSFSVPELGAFRAHWRMLAEHAALAGLFVVSGAGNFGRPGSDGYAPVPKQLRSPEDIPLAVFGVSGIGATGRRPAFSSRGPVLWDVVHYDEGLVDKPDLATINDDVPVLGTDGRVLPRRGGGNSYAGPHLAAVLALMLEADPDLTPWAARALLSETAIDRGPMGFDPLFGAGLVDAFAAVRAVERRRLGR
ncbi:MAG: S8 family serine peptidase [Myxococcota bacterium]